eukprot:13303382-Ditylum_brightwellii.AAC.1
MWGIHNAANLDETSEFNGLKEKATGYINAMSACPFPQHEAWICYLTIFLPSITYSLCTTPLSKKKCKILQNNSHPKNTTKNGVPKKFPKSGHIQSTNKNRQQVSDYGQMGANVCQNEYSNPGGQKRTTPPQRKMAEMPFS